MRRFRSGLRAAVGPIALIVALATAGCSSGSGSDPFRRFLIALTPPPAPEARSPEEVLRHLEWCWNRRDLVRYGELPTEDFRFAFSPLEPSADVRDRPWTREDELISAGHLFLGGDAYQPAASSIALHFDRNVLVLNDPRPGKNPRWHKSTRAGVALTVVAGDNESHVTGFENFFFVRGDSAMIPPELRERGLLPDSSRWYIERWEDDTAPNGSEGLRALPTKSVTWGLLKALYR